MLGPWARVRFFALEHKIELFFIFQIKFSNFFTNELIQESGIERTGETGPGKILWNLKIRQKLML